MKLEAWSLKDCDRSVTRRTSILPPCGFRLFSWSSVLRHTKLMKTELTWHPWINWVWLPLQWLVHLFKSSCYISKVWRMTISPRFSECIVWLCFPQRCLAKSCLDAMEKPLHKADCFLQVSSTISTRCNQDHMPEDERIHGSPPILDFNASYSPQHL